MRLYVRLVFGVLRRSTRGRSDLLIENLALRQQLAVYTRQGRRPQLRNADRRFWSLLARSWSEWRSTLVLVQPDTVVRWHRTAWRRYWTWKSRSRGRGRPRIDAELRGSSCASPMRTRAGARCGSWASCAHSASRSAPAQCVATVSKPCAAHHPRPGVPSCGITRHTSGQLTSSRCRRSRCARSTSWSSWPTIGDASSTSTSRSTRMRPGSGGS